MGEPTYPTCCVSCCPCGPNGQILTKLRDDSNRLAGVDSKARPIERRVAHAVRVKIAAGLVTSTCSAVESLSPCEPWTRSRGKSVRVWRRTGGSSASTLSKSGWNQNLTQICGEIMAGRTARVWGVSRGNLCRCWIQVIEI
jgi:hypothetical protein